jgi:hypothetical protein
VQIFEVTDGHRFARFSALQAMEMVGFSSVTWAEEIEEDLGLLTDALDALSGVDDRPYFEPALMFRLCIHNCTPHHLHPHALPSN